MYASYDNDRVRGAFAIASGARFPKCLGARALEKTERKREIPQLPECSDRYARYERKVEVVGT